MDCNQVFGRVLSGQSGHLVNPSGQLGHSGFWLFLFFLKPGPVPTPSQLGHGSTGRVGF
jgi:hypothetical protein